jgi:hypothetical protein
MVDNTDCPPNLVYRQKPHLPDLEALNVAFQVHIVVEVMLSFRKPANRALC